ncbi:kinase-like domain-containing protein [Lentinula aciculospora]|uniref:Kinase-like domain-containing protein n=1 Tax=Lentinula aciculospora TaxID=153920 RepID=A0A9W9AM41_9AGAR|nr:kinase-like domain-containing protein [Lentinula aciculospora]
MVNDRTHRSSSSTWTSSIHTYGTWAVRPTATTLLTTMRRKASQMLGDQSSRAEVPSLQTSSSEPRRYTSSDRSSDSGKSLPAVEDIVPPPPLSPVYPSFQWIRGDLIGEGSYGRVYWALNITTCDIIAVKQVELARNPSRREKENVEALKLESYTLKDLNHLNIVQFLGFEESVDHLSIFMEYIAGGTIGSCLKAHGKFNDEVTKAFARQMLEGLEYLHSRGIIHRDIKADNILVDRSGVCKISDFGISKQAEDINGRAFTGMRGTVYWMAPEAVNPKETNGYDAKVDIWSIGCVVLEMWSGRRPWHGEEQIPVLLKLYNQKLPPPIPAGLLLSDEAMDFRERAFTINPKERASAAVLRSHPYLVMKPGWTFNPAYIEGPADGRNTESFVRHAKGYSAISDKTVRRIRSNKALPPVPEPPVPPTPSLASSHRVHLDSGSSPSAPILPNTPGPPIVWITAFPVSSKPPQVHNHDDNLSTSQTLMMLISTKIENLSSIILHHFQMSVSPGLLNFDPWHLSTTTIVPDARRLLLCCALRLLWLHHWLPVLNMRLPLLESRQYTPRTATTTILTSRPLCGSELPSIPKANEHPHGKDPTLKISMSICSNSFHTTISINP